MNREGEWSQGKVLIPEAAELLNVSESYVEDLLRRGHLPFVLVDGKRRIPRDPLLEYKRTNDERRWKALAELTALGQEMGEYDDDHK